MPASTPPSSIPPASSVQSTWGVLGSTPSSTRPPGGGFDWVDVRDVVLGLVSAAERGRTGENYLLPGHQATALHLGRMAAAFGGHLGPVVAIPGQAARWVAPLGERVGRLLHSEAFTPASIGTLLDSPIVDGAKALAELGHRPRPLEDSVRDTVRWFEGEAHL
jgi:dihydroflavonol-4-reductase